MTKANGTGPDPYKDERGEKGYFLPGNRGGGGNPHANLVNVLRKAALNAVEPEVYAGIMRKMAELALKGNVRAAMFVYERNLGKPEQTVEIRGDIAETIAVVHAGLAHLAARLKIEEVSL